MPCKTLSKTAATAVLAGTAMLTAPAAAETPAEFFGGKTINVYVAVGSSAYDL
jgi:uncharacterized protein YraI